MFKNSQEICAFLQISNSTLKQLRKKGLPFNKVSESTIRYDLEAVTKWVKSQSTNNQIGVK